jgi:NitT/TauT family transport system permease protein
MRAETLRTLSWHALFLSVVLGLWEWGARTGWVDPSFMGSPLGIIQFWNTSNDGIFLSV